MLEGRGPPAMEQIYYTQCPIGYGLGASNGFQVKRLSEGYPITGDFQHLGFRAHLPGTRTLAPVALRFRASEEGTAEVALLTPRTHEYETERGLWGRPGGHFAHGLRLEMGEMARIHQWPAGLIGHPFWRKADPEPSLGRPPDPFAEELSLGAIEPNYQTATSLATGFEHSFLACLLTALGSVTRDARTLSLVDRPARLGDRVALLTLAIPEVWRCSITFSTYHDRPEELPGFRLQGTGPDPRLNRQALKSQGFLADLTAGTLEPPIQPARWAVTLAGWLVDRCDAHRLAWESTDRLAATTAKDGPAGPFWPDDWLDRLYDFPEQARGPIVAITDPSQWRRLSDLTAWAREVGTDKELAHARTASWWRTAACEGDEAREALVQHLRLSGSWRGLDDGKTWGRVVAGWLDHTHANRGHDLMRSVLETVPSEARPSFLRGLIDASGQEVSQERLRWLKGHPGIDTLALLPLEVRGVAERSAGDSPRRFWRDLLARAVASRATLIEVLDAISVETSHERQARLDAIYAVGDVLAHADERLARVILRWALDGERVVEGWLGPYLSSLASGADACNRWGNVYNLVERSHRPAFTRMALGVATGNGVHDDVFGWSIETLLLPLAEHDRPHDPRWPGTYLDRTVSGLELIRRLYGREYRELGVKAWLDAARQRGELSTEQVGRVERCARYTKALKSGDARILDRVELPDVRAGDRGPLLAQLLMHLGSAGDSFWRVLDACFAAWPEGFGRGAEGLSEIAGVLADQLLPVRENPETWMSRLIEILDRLRLRSNASAGFEPDGLAAEILAATVRRPSSGFSPWRLRQYVLRDAEAWRALGADVRQDLVGKTVAECIETLERWDRDLAKGVHSSRFFEVWLNSSDPATLGAIVSKRGGDLRTLPILSWWNAGAHQGACDDLREAFARFAPMAPLAEDTLSSVQNWMRRGNRPEIASSSSAGPSPLDGDLVALDDEPTSKTIPVAQAPSLSRAAWNRWRWLEALSAFSRSGLDADGRWQIVEAWTHDLPLAMLGENDRWIVVAWLILRLDDHDGPRIARLVSWLVRSGMSDPERVVAWSETLASLIEVPGGLKLARSKLVSELRSEWRTVVREARERGSKTREPGFPTTH